MRRSTTRPTASTACAPRSRCARRWSGLTANGERAEKTGRAFKPVKFGIGLNTGECSVGNMGSEQRFDYSALGDEVNIASRLEGSSKQFGVDIVASSATRDEAPEFAWLEIDAVKLKNKTRAVALYALAGGPAYAESEEFRGLLALHEEMLDAYRARKFAAARRLADEAAPARSRRGRRALRLLRQAVCRARRRDASRELGADDRARRKIVAVPRFRRQNGTVRRNARDASRRGSFMR